MKLKDNDGALRYLEQKLKLQKEVLEDSPNSIDLAKTHKQMGELLDQTRSYKLSLD